MEHSENGTSGHTSTKLYWVFCFILSFITFLEWASLHFKASLPFSNGMIIATLVVLSLVKFIMVVGWYMHLRYDVAMLKQVFIASAILITGIAVALVVTMTSPKHAIPAEKKTSQIVSSDGAFG